MNEIQELEAFYISSTQFLMKNIKELGWDPEKILKEDTQKETKQHTHEPKIKVQHSKDIFYNNTPGVVQIGKISTELKTKALQIVVNESNKEQLSSRRLEPNPVVFQHNLDMKITELEKRQRKRTAKNQLKLQLEEGEILHSDAKNTTRNTRNQQKRLFPQKKKPNQIKRSYKERHRDLVANTMEYEFGINWKEEQSLISKKTQNKNLSNKSKNEKEIREKNKYQHKNKRQYYRSRKDDREYYDRKRTR